MNRWGKPYGRRINLLSNNPLEIKMADKPKYDKKAEYIKNVLVKTTGKGGKSITRTIPIKMKPTGRK